MLVVEAHQALVAGGLAGGLSVVALVVEVAALQGFSCGSCDGFGLLDEAAEDSGSSFGGFVEESGELGFFELEELLAASLEGVLEGGDQAGVAAQVGPGEADEEDVLGAVDVEAEVFCAAGARGVVSRGLGRGVADFSAFEVDQEAGWDGGASEAVVDAEEGGGRGVEEPEDGRAVVGDVGFLGARGSSFLGELEAGFQLVAAPAPLFFVAGDALAPAGSDVGHFEEGDDLAIASVEADLADRAEVERGLAEGSAGTAEAQGPPPLVQASRRGLEAGDLPLVAFVVEDVARREFAQGEEARVDDEFAFSSRDPGPHGEGREVVARQEAFAGEVAVGVEVAFLAGDFELPQEVQLAERLVVLGSGLLLVFSAPRPEEGVLGHLELALRGAVEVAPAVEGTVEFPGRIFDHAVDPVVGEPACRIAQSVVGGQDLADLLAELVAGGGAELDLVGWVGAQGEVVQLGVDDLLDGLAEEEVDVGEPDGVDVGAQKGLVGEVEARGAPAACDHVLTVAEEVLVVAVDGAAVGEDEAGLPLAASPATPLGVVGVGGNGYN